MPRASRRKNWYERLDEDTRAIVLAFGVIIFLLILAFFLANPILAAIVFGLLALGAFTIYSKHKTGRWWWKSYPSAAPPSTAPLNPRPDPPQNQPIMTERETVTTTREVFLRTCSHCGAKVPGTRTSCPNCGGLM